MKFIGWVFIFLFLICAILNLLPDEYAKGVFVEGQKGNLKDGFICLGCAIIFLGGKRFIASIKKSGKKNLIMNNEQTSTNNFKQPTTSFYYSPEISRAVIMVLESMHIMENSKNVDIVKGRNVIFVEQLNYLRSEQNNPIYNSAVTLALDKYKTDYYNIIPSGNMLGAIINPTEYNEVFFYIACLVLSFIKFYDEQKIQIKSMVKTPSIKKRYENIVVKIQFVYNEIIPYNTPSNNEKTNNAFQTEVDQLNKLYNEILNIMPK